ncbi:MAG: glycerate kinase [Nocardioidaceae bacterium]
MTRVLVAPDKFKGSLSASDVAHAVAAGLLRQRPDLDIRQLPIADGGDGTLDAACAAGFTRVDLRASGPTGILGHTAYARRGNEAVIEMATTCGLNRLPERRTAGLTASSRGLGEVIVQALEDGCTDLVVGIGGSASTDGGAGMLVALGARLTDARGEPSADGVLGLTELATVDLSALHPALRDATITIASDVDNPLTGPRGAAAVYGPQKGLRIEEVALADHALTRWADLVARATGSDRRDAPGSGAAGGVGFAAISVLDAGLRSGIDLMLDLTEFDDAVQSIDLVVTGEGSLDEQSLAGKAPVGVARRAAARDVTTVAVCGRLQVDRSRLASVGIHDVYALTDLEPDPVVCMRDASELLTVLGERIGQHRLPRPGPVIRDVR